MQSPESDQPDEGYVEAPAGSVPAQMPSTIPPAVGEPLVTDDDDLDAADESDEEAEAEADAPADAPADPAPAPAPGDVPAESAKAKRPQA